jgi:hypothetical protein
MLLDMHIVHALTNGWKVYRDSLAAFSELFPVVAAATLAEWHALLVAEEPEIRATFAPGTPEAFPLISVELMSETPEVRGLGNSLGIEDGGTRRILGFTAGQRAEVSIIAKRDEATRALSVIVRAVMLRAVKSFMRSGYVSIQYEGAGELSLDEMLVAEELGIYSRRLSYSARVEVAVPEQPAGTVLPTKPWFIQLDAVADDPVRDPATGAGTPGGVTPADD